MINLDIDINTIVQQILTWIGDNLLLAYIMVFLVSLSESLVVVGLIVPGIIIMGIIGTLIGTGHLGLYPTLAAAILGAIVGDGLSYWIGKSFQTRLRNLFIFRKYPETIIRCEKFFAKHGGKSVVFGRFVGPVRPMIPAIAGMMKMSPVYFYTVNILSAFIWAPSYLIPGILFGNTLSNLPQGVGKKLVLIVALAILFIFIFSKIIKYTWRKCKRYSKRWGTRLWYYAENNSLTLLQKIIKHPLAHKKHQVDSFIFLLICIAATLIYVKLTSLHIITTNYNPIIKHISLILYNEDIYYFLNILNSFGSPILIFSLFTVVLVYLNILNIKHNHYASIKKNISNKLNILSLLLIFSYILLSYIISSYVAYPAPYISIEDSYSVYSYSFPNFSIGLLTIFLGYIGIIKYCSSPYEYINSSYNFYAISIITIFFVIKLYTSNVWLTDLICGLLLAACLLLLYCIIYWQNPIKYLHNQNINLVGNIKVNKLNIIIISSFAILGLINTTYLSINNYYDNLTHKYNFQNNIITTDLNYSKWLEQSNKFSLFDSISNPVINVQWLSADKKEIINLLEKNNWQAQPNLTFSNALNFLEKKPNNNKLPLIPAYYQDHNAVLSYSLTDKSNKIINIRLWQSEYLINNKPLWIGTIQYFKPINFFNAATLLVQWPANEFSNATDYLAKIINTSKKYQAKFFISNNKTLTDDDLKIILIN